MDETDAAILAFERSWWHRDGAYGVKDQAIVLRLRMSPVGYYKRLAALVRSDAALAFDEPLVQHLRSLLNARHASLRVSHTPATLPTTETP